MCEHDCSNCLVLFAFTEVQLEQKSVPTAVFGGLKDDWKANFVQHIPKFFLFFVYL